MLKICRKCNQMNLEDADECIMCGGRELDIATEEEINVFSERVRKENNEAIVREAFKREENVPKCPTCGSTNVEPITWASSIASTLLLGPYSKTYWSQFQCNNCGYMW